MSALQDVQVRRPRRTFQIVDLQQLPISDNGPISDLAAMKLEAFPFPVQRHEYTGHLTTLDSPFDWAMAQNVAEIYALGKCRWSEGTFDLLVFEDGNDLTFRVAIEVEQRPVAECHDTTQVAP